MALKLSMIIFVGEPFAKTIPTGQCEDSLGQYSIVGLFYFILPNLQKVLDTSFFGA